MLKWIWQALLRCLHSHIISLIHHNWFPTTGFVFNGALSAVIIHEFNSKNVSARWWIIAEQLSDLNQIFQNKNRGKQMSANPPLISSKLYCAEVYYSRTFGLVKYKCKFVLNSAVWPSPVSSPLLMVLRTNLHFKRWSSPFMYLDPKHSHRVLWESNCKAPEDLSCT